MTAMRRCGLALVCCMVALGPLVIACGSGDATLADVDPDVVPLDPDYQLVANIIDRACVPCHDSGGTSPALVTCQDVVDNRLANVDRAITKNDMPPGAWPRLTSEERLIITRWTDNGAKAPCN